MDPFIKYYFCQNSLFFLYRYVILSRFGLGCVMYVHSGTPAC